MLSLNLAHDKAHHHASHFNQIARLQRFGLTGATIDNGPVVTSRILKGVLPVSARDNEVLSGSIWVAQHQMVFHTSSDRRDPRHELKNDGLRVGDKNHKMSSQRGCESRCSWWWLQPQIHISLKDNRLLALS